MHTYSSQSDIDIFFTKSGFTKLSNSNSRIRKGTNVVLISPVGERAGPTELFEEWERIYTRGLEKLNEDLREIEDKQKSKFGPRSIAVPWKDIKETLLDSYKPININTNNLRESIKGVYKLRPTSIAKSAQYTKNFTQAGAPTLEKKGLVRDETVRDFDRLFEEDLPMICATRTQEQRKTRIVNIYPFVDIINENRFFVPLFSELKKLQCFAAFNGPDSVDQAVTEMLLRARDDSTLICLSGDISNFDNNVKAQLQSSAFDVIRGYFQKSYSSQLDEIASRFLSKPLVTPDDTIIYGDHGIPSGSNFTGVVGTLVNWLVINLPNWLIQVMGDDFIALVNSPDELKSKFTTVGLELNLDKSFVKPSCFVYLQRLHHLDYMVDGEAKGIYPTWRALNRLIYLERFTNFEDFDLNGRDYFAIRSLSILENCKHHPLFEELVKFWMSYDKYKLPSNSSINAYVKMQESKITSVGSTNQYGDLIEGIRSFESYKIAKQLV